MNDELSLGSSELERLLGTDLRAHLEELAADNQPAVFAIAGINLDDATRLAPQVEAFFAERGIPQCSALDPYEGELTATVLTRSSWRPEDLNELRDSLRLARQNKRCIIALLPGYSGRFAAETYLGPFFKEGRNLILMDT